MAKTAEQTENDDLVSRARPEADALGQLYEKYYERVLRFCVHRLFNKEVAEDVTSTVFLSVARGIRSFKGQSEQDFRNWLYTIAINQTNAYIRKTSRRKRLLAEATDSMKRAPQGVPKRTNSTDDLTEPNWPMLYAAILKLKPEHQTIVTLRFFEKLKYEQIAQIINIPETTVRVTLHRILNKLRRYLQSILDGEM